MKTKQSFRLLVMAFMLMALPTSMLAQEYITEIMCLGTKKGGGTELKKKYRDKGWTVLDTDLNSGAGGWDVFLAYKTDSTANPEKGYITDIRASISTDKTYNTLLRTYHRAPTNEGFSGDMNNAAGGADIYIFYTRDRVGLTDHGGTKRVITSLSTSSRSDDGDSETGVVRWFDADAGACDMNSGAGGADIYLYYTRDRANLSTCGGTKRVIETIGWSKSKSNADNNQINVQWYSN